MAATKPAAEHDSCGAKRLKTDDACRLPAGWGTDHPGIGRCRLHGGATPSHRRHAVLVEAKRDLAAWGGRLDVTPPQALLELVQAKAAEVAYWDQRVAELGEEERAGLLIAKTERGHERGEDVSVTTRQASPHIFVVMLHKAQDQLATYAAAATRVGVDKALVELAVMQGQTYLDFGRRVAAAAGAPSDQIPAILRTVLEEQR